MFNWIMNFIDGILFSLIIPCIGLGIFMIIGSKFIPNLLPQYKLPVQIGGAVLVLFFIFQAGREWEFDKQKIQKEADKALIEKLKSESKIVSDKVKIKYIEKIKYVEKIKNVPVIEYVNKEDDRKCVISPDVGVGIAKLLNAAATGELPSSTSGTNGTIK